MNTSFDPNTGLAIIAPPTTTPAGNASMWGAIAAAAAGLGSTALGYFPNNREANVAIAQSQADAATANAQAAALAAQQQKDKNMIYIVVAVLVVALVYFMTRKK